MAIEHPRGPYLDGPGCPDTEQLSEYAEARLPSEQRETVEQHLVDCAYCREALSETTAFLTAERQGSPVVMRPVQTMARREGRRRRGWPIVVAVAGAAAALFVFVRIAPMEWTWNPGRSDRPELKELVAAVANEPTRPVEGRVTGGFKYAPPPSQTRGPGETERSPEIRIAAARIEKAEAERTSSRAKDALGVAALILGMNERAIAALEDATAQEPDRADWQSDLAAAYLASFRTGRKPEHLPKALNAAETAVRLNPQLVEARFNRALALELSGSRAAALAAWQDFLAVERDEHWRQEAAHHIAFLSAR